MTDDEAIQFIQLLDNIDPKILGNITAVLNSDIVERLHQSLAVSKELLHKQNIKDELEFSLWNSIWNDYGIYGAKREEHRNNSASSLFGKGRFLYLDFGQHNIGAEFSFSHMGIVIKDFGNLIIVVPITSDRGQKYSGEVEQCVIRVKKKNYKQFHDNSVILTHQTQCLGKNRINRYLGQSINKTPLMAEIETTLAKTYSPYIFGSQVKKISHLQSIIDNKEERIKYLERIIKEQNINEPRNILSIDNM